MRRFRKMRRDKCPICGGGLEKRASRLMCIPCNIEIVGSSLKPIDPGEWTSWIRFDLNR